MELPLDLELAIQQAPDDREGYSVAADWLQQAGSPHGELVALALADDRDEIIDRVIELKHQLVPVEVRTLSPATLEWRWGFVRGIQLASIADPTEPRMLRDLLASPIARFVQKLVVDRPSRALVDAIFDAASPRTLRCMRTLMLFCDHGLHPIDLAQLSAAMPNLRRLVLRNASTHGALELPRLLELGVHGVADVPRMLASSSLPALDTLQVGGAELSDPDRSLDPARLPALRSLSLTIPAFDPRAWLASRIAVDLVQLDHFDIVRGRPSTRTFVIDKRPRVDRSELLVVVGRGEHRPGTVIAIDRRPFRIGRSKRSRLRLDAREVTMQHCEIDLRGDWRVRGGPVHVNGHWLAECRLRSMDELAIGDHVFRFLEGDRADAVRARYGL